MKRKLKTGFDDRVRSTITPAAFGAAMSGDLANALVAMTLGGIEWQEADEQRKAVAAQRLPKEGTRPGETRLRCGASDREVWEKLGFVFAGDHDDLFVNVTFPAGWQLKPTDHSMWNVLLDDKGRKRGSMFYKGAFYDREAHVHLSCRFAVDTYHGITGKRGETFGVVITDCGNVIHEVGKWEDGNYGDCDRLRAEAEAWLNERHPDWTNPLACWEQSP